MYLGNPKNLQTMYEGSCKNICKWSTFRKNDFASEDISFLLAPLINSAGRMEDATKAYEFLKSKTLKEAFEKLEYLIKLNNTRKEIELDITKKAELKVKKKATFPTINFLKCFWNFSSDKDFGISV